MGNGVIFDCEDYTVFLLPCADGCQGILPNLGNQFGQFLLNGQVDHPHSGEANGHPDVTSGADSVVNLNMLRCEMVQLLIKGVGHKSESLMLSDRIIVMTESAGRIPAIHDLSILKDIPPEQRLSRRSIRCF